MKQHKVRIAVVLFIIESLFQIAGGLFYDVCPSWLWSICDASMMLIPILFGLSIGIIVCIPNTIAEMIWFISNGYIGPALHAVTFLIAAIALGWIKEMLDRHMTKLSIPIRLICFELFLMIEELLYVLLRIACGTSNIEALTWERISVDFLSVGNLICLVTGWAYLWKHRPGKTDSDTGKTYYCDR